MHIIAWMFFAIATAMVAKAKNRSVAKWGMMGLCFGLLGLIAIGFVPQKLKVGKESI
ncbi:MAG: hypothetical protein ACRC28_10495 [Clostridium sp.]|uniref:hypothetical protein n=1 Tax=Clostridium sp. TaxID=1506 RepID=UPI003F2B599E